MWSVIFARLALMFVAMSFPHCNSLAAQAQTVITLPCGVSSRYTSSNVTDGMMLVIRRCAGSRVVNGVQVLITTSLTLDFNSSTLSAPKNLSVLIEDSVNVNLQVSGGTGINLNGMSVLSGFNLTMKNVTNPSSPKPTQACTATSTLLWCASLVYFQYVSFQDSTIALDTITFDRSSAVASVLQIYNTSQLQNVVVTLVNVTHDGSHPVVNVDAAAQADIVASAASNFHLLMMHVTVYTSGIVATGRIIGVFLWISQLSLVDTSIVLHDVDIDDGGISGQASGVLFSSLPPSRNVSVTYINAVVSFIGATYYGAYVVDSDMSSSTFLFQNHTLFGGDLAVMYAIAVFTTSLSFNSVVAVSDIQIMSGASNLVAFGACTLSNSIMNISNIELQASINGGNLATITYTTNGVGSLISDMAISISDCYCAIDFVGSMTVLTVSKSVIRRVTIDTFNVTLDGDSGMGVVVSGSPATVALLSVIVGYSWSTLYSFLA